MNKPTVIVLDDDLNMAKLIAEMTKKIGYESSITNTVDNLLAMISKNNFDVIVMDVCIPDKDGIELINQLAKDNNCSELIIMSGYENSLLEGVQFLAEMKGLNVLGILGKPFGINELTTTLEKSMRNLKPQLSS